MGGGENNVRMITVATYDSAYLQAAFLGNKFRLIVFDEVHHLASPSYMQIAQMYTAPYRMGLTATFERIDERHELLPQLVGGLVFNIEVDELTGKHLATRKNTLNSPPKNKDSTTKKWAPSEATSEKNAS